MKPSATEEYLFDLRGFLVLRKAVDPEHLDELNKIVDGYEDRASDEWRGWVHRSPLSIETDQDKSHLHNVFEMGGTVRAFDRPTLLDRSHQPFRRW